MPVTFLQPGRLDTRTGGTIYNRRIVDGLRGLGRTVNVHELDPSFPFAPPSAVAAASDVLAGVPDDEVVVADSLVVPQLSDALAREAARLRVVALMHLPAALNPSLDTAVAGELGRFEARVLGVASRIVVTGRSIVPMVAVHVRDSSRIVVVEPGVDSAPPGRGTAESGTLEILCVANVVPGKGHDLLLTALSGLTGRAWHLTCAGSLDRDRAFAARVDAQAKAGGLSDRVSFTGELDDALLTRAYAAADLFVLPTRFETYGMAVAEAIAHGLPVVSTATGAIPELVGDLAGLVIAPNDATALRGALALVMDDKMVRRRFRAGAIRMRTRLQPWDAAARAFNDTIEAAARG